MAVPKKRTGHSAQGKRRANWKATKPETTKCPTCGETVLTHTVCTACGTYKGQPVRLADKAAAVAAAPAKKTTKIHVKKVLKTKLVAPKITTIPKTATKYSVTLKDENGKVQGFVLPESVAPYKLQIIPNFQVRPFQNFEYDENYKILFSCDK